MSIYKVLLLDVDGVLIRQHQLFSHAYAEEFGYDKKDFDKFFSEHFMKALRGETTYKQLAVEHNDVWRWDKDPQELMDKWFAFGTEENMDRDLVNLAKKVHKEGLKVFLATNQDAGRAEFLSNLFSEFLDGTFASYQLGYVKEEAGFFQLVIKRLQKDIKGMKPSQILFFDDDPLNIKSAKALDISAHIYKDANQVRKYLTS